jgi:hypothetical protein
VLYGQNLATAAIHLKQLPLTGALNTPRGTVHYL